MLVLLAACVLCLAARPAGADEMPPADRLELAHGLYDRGLLDLALNEYRRLAEQHPDFERRDAVLYRLGLCYRRLERLPEAADTLQRLLNEYPESAYRHQAALRRAVIDADAGDAAAAERRLRSLLAAQPPPDIEAAARHELALLLAARDRPAEAEAEWAAIVDAFADSPYAGHAALNLGGLLLARAERRGEARAMLLHAARHGPGAVAGEAHFLLGLQAFQDAAYEDAATALQQLFSAHPTHPRAAEAALPLAWSRYYLGRYLEVLALAAKVDDDDPAADAWLYLRANAQRGLYRNAPALAAYDALLKTFTDSPYREAAAYERAVLAVQAGDHAGALAVLKPVDFSAALREDVYWLQAEAYAAETRRDEALQAYRLLAEHYPDSARTPHALYRMAQVLRDSNDLAAAYAMLRRLAQTYPKADETPQALLEAAALMWDQDDHEQAVRDWSLLIENYPQAAQREHALYRRALAQARMQRTDPALLSLRSLLQDYPATAYAPQVQGWIGLLLARREEWAAAEEALRKALDMPLDEAWRREVQWRLVHVLQQRGSPREAADLMQPLLSTASLKAMDPAQLEWLARFRLEAQAWSEAVTAAEALVAHAQDAVWQEIGWYLIGRGLEAQERPSDARRAYRRAGSRQAGTREGAAAWLREGRLAVLAGEAEVARRAFEDALRRVGNDDAQLDLRARAYMGLGTVAGIMDRPEEALRYYLAVGVLFDHPQWTPESMARAAEVLASLGRERESREILQELQERYPEYTAAETEAAPDAGSGERAEEGAEESTP